MESLREQVQHIRELAHLAVTTLPQPLVFPSLDSILAHFPSTSRQINNTPTSFPNTKVIPPVTPTNPPNPPIHTPYVPQYVQTPQNSPITPNATHAHHCDRVTFTTHPNQHIPVAHIVTPQNRGARPALNRVNPTEQAC